MEGNFDGFRAVATICCDLKDYARKADTPWFFGISTPLTSPTSEGLPTNDEAEELNRWEEIIEGEIGSEGKYVFVGRVSWKGYRELLYYVDSPQDAARKMKNLIQAGSTRPFAFTYKSDPDWTSVRIYLHEGLLGSSCREQA